MTRVLRALMILALTPLAAGAGEGEAMFYGPGAGLSCGAWLGDGTKDSAYYANRTWLLGFVSGAGAAGIKLKETDHEAMFAWMDKYCRDNPLDDVAEASRKLVVALRAKAPKKQPTK